MQAVPTLSSTAFTTGLSDKTTKNVPVNIDKERFVYSSLPFCFSFNIIEYVQSGFLHKNFTQQ